jgi:Flp pilus assembly protein CpaB
VSRRARAIGFGSAAVLCAVMAAAIASGYSGRVAGQFGLLRPVVVATSELPAHETLRATDADRLLEVRRVPARFVPPNALTAPGAAVGLAPAAPIPTGSYVLAEQLRAPGSNARREQRPAAGPGRQPVEVAVTGAEALAASGHDPTGMRVDVVVTTEPGPGGGEGHTYVAAGGVRLLALAEGTTGDDADDPLATAAAWTATLALTRPQALRLIQAEAFARSVRLIAAG